MLLLLMGCSKNATQKEIKVASNQLEKPPSIHFLYNDEKYQLMLGTYSWVIENEDGTTTGVEADCAAPPELVKHQEFKIIAKNHTPVKVVFDNEPERYEIGIWENNQLYETVTVDEDHSFLLSADKEKDSIVYELVAYWSQGSASYAITVDVEQENDKKK